MTEDERLSAVEEIQAIEEIKKVKARYFRGVDTGDTDLVRSILAEDCELDLRGCCTDPATGRDFMPNVNVVLRGRRSFAAEGLAESGIVSVHQGHHCEIELTSPTTASGIWSMTDRLYMPAGSPFACMTGFGHYIETYEKVDGAWKIKTLRITRIRVEAT
jgi:hypothetical protein